MGATENIPIKNEIYNQPNTQSSDNHQNAIRYAAVTTKFCLRSTSFQNEEDSGWNWKSSVLMTLIKTASHSTYSTETVGILRMQG